MDGVLSEADSEAASAKTLGSLLGQHDLLLKVLSCVMDDDGLHECRLVCRRWRDACGELLLRIQVPLGFDASNVVKTVAERFPNATALRVEDFEGASRRDVMDAESIPYLSRLTKLHTLQIRLSEEHRATEKLRPVLLSLNRLQSVSFRFDDVNSFIICADILRCLTRLTSLDLYTEYQTGPTGLDPITELRGLVKLSGDLDVLAVHGNQLLFPALTQLTELKVKWPYIHQFKRPCIYYETDGRSALLKVISMSASISSDLVFSL